MLVEKSSKSKKQKTKVNGSAGKKARQPRTVPVYVNAKELTAL